MKFSRWMAMPLILSGLTGCYYPAYPAPPPQAAYPAPAPGYYYDPAYYPSYYAAPAYPAAVGGSIYFGGGGYHHWH